MQKKHYQYVRTEKGALVRGWEVQPIKNPAPRTLGGLITKTLFEKGVQLLVWDK